MVCVRNSLTTSFYFSDFFGRNAEPSDLDHLDLFRGILIQNSTGQHSAVHGFSFAHNVTLEEILCILRHTS